MDHNPFWKFTVTKSVKKFCFYKTQKLIHYPVDNIPPDPFVITLINVGLEVLKAVVMKNSIFWDVKLCGPLKVNGSFGGTCRLHLQCRSISQVRNQQSLPPAYTLVFC
jgi:hypothetical protein